MSGGATVGREAEAAGRSAPGGAAGRALGVVARWFSVRSPLRPLALFLAALIAFAPGQFALPPSDRDEARFAQASKQMLETGDFVDIRFRDEPRHKKPAGIYWLQAASASMFGGAEAPIWAYRLPSWIGAAAAVGLTAWALAPLIGAPASALAALAMAAGVLLHVEARIAKTDAALLAATLVAMGALARLWLREATGWAARLLLWGAVGVGVLLKGPIIFLPVGGAILWTAVAERSAAGLRAARPLAGLAIALLIAAPWLVAITLVSDGGFWAESVGQDLAGKVASGQEAHWGPPGYHLGVFWGVFWPFAALLPFAIWALWPRRRETAFRLLAGWIVPTWIVFELAPTKLPHYPLPVYPALAGLIAVALLDARGALARMSVAPLWAKRTAFGLWALPAVVLTLGAAFAVPAVEGRVSWGGLLLAGLAAPLLWIAGRAIWGWRLRDMIAPAAGGAILLYAAAFQFVIPGLETGFVSPRLAAAAERWRCGAEGPVALGHYREPSAVFALGTDTLIGRGPEAATALAESDAALVFVDARDRDAFLAEAEARRIAPEALTVVEGFNYSRGDPVAITLYGPEGQAARCGRAPEAADAG